MTSLDPGAAPDVSPPPATRRSAPVAVWVLQACLWFVGLTALASALAAPGRVDSADPLSSAGSGGAAALVLGLVCTAAAIGLWRRPRPGALGPVESATGRHWSWSLAIVAGVATVAWGLVHAAVTGRFGLIEPIMVLLGVDAVFLALLPATRGFYRAER